MLWAPVGKTCNMGRVYANPIHLGIGSQCLLVSTACVLLVTTYCTSNFECLKLMTCAPFQSNFKLWSMQRGNSMSYTSDFAYLKVF